MPARPPELLQRHVPSRVSGTPQETTAITQNYVSGCNLPHVLRHLQDPNLVSGCSVEERATLHDRFVDALQDERPQVC